MVHFGDFWCCDLLLHAQLQSYYHGIDLQFYHVCNANNIARFTTTFNKNRGNNINGCMFVNQSDNYNIQDDGCHDCNIQIRIMCGTSCCDDSIDDYHECLFCCQLYRLDAKLIKQCSSHSQSSSINDQTNNKKIVIEIHYHGNRVLYWCCSLLCLSCFLWCSVLCA